MVGYIGIASGESPQEATLHNIIVKGSSASAAIGVPQTRCTPTIKARWGSVIADILAVESSKLRPAILLVKIARNPATTLLRRCGAADTVRGVHSRDLYVEGLESGTPSYFYLQTAGDGCPYQHRCGAGRLDQEAAVDAATFSEFNARVPVPRQFQIRPRL